RLDASQQAGSSSAAMYAAALDRPALRIAPGGAATVIEPPARLACQLGMPSEDSESDGPLALPFLLGKSVLREDQPESFASYWHARMVAGPLKLELSAEMRTAWTTRTR